MNWFSAWILIAIWLSASPGAMALEPNNKHGRELAAEAEDIELLLEALGDDTFATRESATRKLWSIGDKALPQLQDATQSPDPELAYRARELIKKIELGITPESNPELLQLVSRYPNAAQNEKSSILKKLRTMRAWKQMLRLYAGEKDPNVQRLFAWSINRIGIQAAREQLLLNKPAQARELLELLPAHTDSLLALAEFHRTQGTLNDELARAQARNGPKAAAWRLALYRADGNFDAARAEAELANDPLMAAAIAAIQSDPIPWLRHISNQAESDGHEVQSLYAKMAIQRWKGESIGADDWQRMRSHLTGEDLRIKNSARSALLLMGQHELAEASLIQESPIEAFWHFAALERTDDALAVLGLDATTYLDPDWISRRIEALGKNVLADQSTQESTEELVTLLTFMENRGLVSEAIELTMPAAMMLAKDSPDGFMALLRRLSEGAGNANSAIWIAKGIGVQWAGDDADKWNSLVRALLGENDLAYIWWDWMPMLKPELGFQDRLHGLLAIMRIGPDPKRLRKAWLQLAWDKLESADAEQENRALHLISNLAFATGDVEASLRAWDMMDPSDGPKVYWGRQALHLSAADRWQDAADIFLSQIERLRDSNNYGDIELHAYAATALRRAGDEERALEHDAVLEVLALGDANEALQIGNGYAYGGDDVRALKWWRRSLHYANPATKQFLSAALRYSESLLLEQDRWQESAAIQEVICAMLNSPDYSMDAPMTFMRQRLKADTCHALGLLPHDRKRSLNILEQTHAAYVTDGALADFFFPALRIAGLLDEHDRWFSSTWETVERVIHDFPNAANTKNTAAWFAARARLKINEAEAYLSRALAEFPEQPAYLDTMAEIQFAKADRQGALRWSEKAINVAPDDNELRKQHRHFKNDALPD